MSCKRFLTLIVLLCISGRSFAQLDSIYNKLLELSERRFLLVPGVSYAPETNFVFGLAGFYKLEPKWSDSTDRESYINFRGTYSLRNQKSLEFGYRIASKKEKFVSYGEIRYQQYPNKYFGHGNSISYDNSENYTPTSLRLRVNGLARIKPWLSVGPRLQFDNVYKVAIQDSGILDNDEVLGKEGGNSFGLGYLLNSDTRSSIFTPQKGHYLEYRHVFFREGLGSDFAFDMYQYDLRKYFKIKKHILAVQHYGHFTSGDVPFNQMASFGGPYRMRGHFSGAYRDNNALLFQADFRYRLRERLVWSVFSGIGWIGEDLKGLWWPENRISVGTGLRLYAPSTGMAFRFDFAYARENSGVYIGVGEAF